jgi:predicted Fe-Mo cluster-binding NifX family protein
MKIAVTSQSDGLKAPVDPRFGRARYFVVVNTETGDVATVDNSTNLNAAQGAGIQSGRNIVDLGVGVLITGHVGPKAFATLQAGGVEIYTGACGTVGESIQQYEAGKLTPAASADVEGHWT